MARQIKSFLQILHLWCGLILCVPLVLLGLTGSILVFENAIESFFDPNPHVFKAGQSRTLSDILQASRTFVSPDMSPVMVQLPVEKNTPAMVRFMSPMPPSLPVQKMGKQEMVLLDRVSLEKIEMPTSRMVLRFIVNYHASLLLKDYGGRSIVGWFGIVMLVLGITGLVLWFPKPHQWKMAFGVKWTAKGFRLHRDIHSATGIWGLLVFVTVSFTGVAMVFPAQTGVVVHGLFGGEDLRSKIEKIKIIPEQGRAIIPIEEAVKVAQNHTMGQLFGVKLPMQPSEPYRLSFTQSNDDAQTPPISIFVHPYTGKVIEKLDPQDYTWGETIMAWSHILHMGQGFGIIWQILVFVVGFLPLVFSVTGIYMYVSKRQRKQMRYKNIAVHNLPSPLAGEGKEYQT